MQQWIEIAIGFITGGGFITLINWKINKNSQKVDYADKAINFMEEQNDKLMKRIINLEEDVAKLWNFKCDVLECKNRKPPKI